MWCWLGVAPRIQRRSKNSSAITSPIISVSFERRGGEGERGKGGGGEEERSKREGEGEWGRGGEGEWGRDQETAQSTYP